MQDGLHHREYRAGAHIGTERQHPDRLREAACLAHTVPGVSLRLTTASCDTILVSHTCLGAALDPCRLRSLLIADDADAVAAVASLRRAEIIGGVVHLGGGLFQRSDPSAADERWFVTSLDHESIVDIVEHCPPDERAAPSVAVTVEPDRALGWCAVRVRDERGDTSTLDLGATWLLTACLVGELVAQPIDRPRP